jgi:hypothetical protein
MNNKSVYVIKKVMVDLEGKRVHVIMTDNHSEILELPYKNIAQKMVDVMNANTDSGWFYEVIEITGRKD